MSIEAANTSFCDMSMYLDNFIEGSSTYDSESGFKRRFVLFGSIEDLDFGPFGGGPPRAGNTFHDKRVRLEFSTPVDEELLGRIREICGRNREVDGEPTFNVNDFCSLNVCGGAFTRKSLGTEREEILGEPYEAEPIEIDLNLPMDAFEGIRRQAAEAYESRRVLSAKVRLVGNALPPKGAGLSEIGLKLNELDISKQQTYAIQSFEICKTRLFFSDRSRVKYLEPEEGEGYGTGLSIMLSSVRYELDIVRPEVTKISCSGRITNAYGKPYQGAEVGVNFWQHGTNRWGETPKQAYFGTFQYFPKDCIPEGFSKDCFPKGMNADLSFDLLYTPSDARHLIQELVGPGPNSNVVLSVLLAVEHAALDGTSKVGGNVRSYGFDVSQPIVATDFDKTATKADVERLANLVGELHELTESIRVGEAVNYLPDQPATKGDMKLLHDSIAQSNVAPLVTRLIESLQYMSSQINRIWWFLLGGLIAGIAGYLAHALPLK